MKRSIEILTKDICFKHEPAPHGAHHPENSNRLVKIIEHLKKRGFTINQDFPIASKEQILSVHDEALFNEVKNSQSSPAYFTPDTFANEYTFEAAMESAGAAIYAMNNSSLDTTFFAATRPPGHHATVTRAMGFCYFNNIAIAARLALEEIYDKVAIIDFDNHYGNGTAAIFDQEPNVLYISSHADPRSNFPGSGFIHEIGSGNGTGYTVNIPLSTRTDDMDIIYLYENVTKPILLEFQPDIIMVSVGFDGYKNDPIGMLGFTHIAFEYFGSLIGRLGTELQIPYISILEGGYDLDKQPVLLEKYLKSLSSQPIKPEKYNSPSTATKNLLNKIKATHQDYWSL